MRCDRAVLVVLGLLLLGLAASAGAQNTETGPIAPGRSMAWEAPPNVTTIADAQSFEVRLYRGPTPLTALVGQVCAASVAPVPAGRISCKAALSPSNTDALNMVGKHAITLSLFRVDVGEGPKSDPLALTSPAGAPTGVRTSP
jgi:hypothetical protein